MAQAISKSDSDSPTRSQAGGVRPECGWNTIMPEPMVVVVFDAGGDGQHQIGEQRVVLEPLMVGHEELNFVGAVWHPGS